MDNFYSYLPVYSLSPKTKYARNATNSVPRGLNMVTNTGPFSSVHHSWMKIIKPEHTTPCSRVIQFWELLETTSCLLHKKHCGRSSDISTHRIQDTPKVYVESNNPLLRFMGYQSWKYSWLCPANKAHPSSQGKLCWISF